MRIEVDRDGCEANGVCEQIAPDMFRVGEDDQLQILRPEPGPDLQDKARQAVQRCPKAALSITED